MRLFVGIPLAPLVIQELSALITRLQSKTDGLRWVMPQSWHITLQFLGYASQQQYECVVERLFGLSSRLVTIQLGEPGIFDRAGIFFVRVRPASALILLQQQVSAATESCGFAGETRPYRPHVTLARRKGQRGAVGFGKLKAKIGDQPRFSSFLAQEFVLYESITRPAGSQYEIRERFPLCGR